LFNSELPELLLALGKSTPAKQPGVYGELRIP
jgi:hypothetical protein